MSRGGAPAREMTFVSLVAKGLKVCHSALAMGGFQSLKPGRVVPNKSRPFLVAKCTLSLLSSLFFSMWSAQLWQICSAFFSGIISHHWLSFSLCSRHICVIFAPLHNQGLLAYILLGIFFSSVHLSDSYSHFWDECQCSPFN